MEARSGFYTEMREKESFQVEIGEEGEEKELTWRERSEREK